MITLTITVNNDQIAMKASHQIGTKVEVDLVHEISVILHEGLIKKGIIPPDAEAPEVQTFLMGTG